MKYIKTIALLMLMQTQINAAPMFESWTTFKSRSSSLSSSSSESTRSNETMADESFSAHSYKSNNTNNPARYNTHELNTSSTKLPPITKQKVSNSIDMTSDSQQLSPDTSFDSAITTHETHVETTLPSIKSRKNKKSSKSTKKDLNSNNATTTDIFMENTAKWLKEHNGEGFIGADPDFLEYNTILVESINDDKTPEPRPVRPVAPKPSTPSGSPRRPAFIAKWTE